MASLQLNKSYSRVPQRGYGVQSVDHRLQVTLLQVQCSADSGPKIEKKFLLHFYPMRPIKSKKTQKAIS